MPVFRPFLVLKDSQTSGRLTRPSGIFSPQPLPEVKLTAPALRELGPFLIQKPASRRMLVRRVGFERKQRGRNRLTRLYFFFIPDSR